MHLTHGSGFTENLIISLNVSSVIESFVDDLNLLDRSSARVRDVDDERTLIERKRMLLSELELLFTMIPEMPEA